MKNSCLQNVKKQHTNASMCKIQHALPGMTHKELRSNAPVQKVLFNAQLNSNAKSSPPRPSKIGEAFAVLK